MESVKIKLNSKEIEYGIIYITKNQHDNVPENFFPKNKGLIKILCDSDKKKINKGGNYISGLTKNNLLHGAYEDTTVEIKKTSSFEYTISYIIDKENDELDKAINQSKTLLKSSIWRFSNNETNVRCELVDRLLSALGWKFDVFEDENFKLFREVYLGEGQGKADYIAFDREKPKLIIEAKPLSNDLREKELNEQLKKYWKSERFPDFSNVKALVTNGQEWQLREFKKGEIKILAKSDILDDPEFKLFIKAFSSNSFDPTTMNGHSMDKEYSTDRKKRPFSIFDRDEKIEGDRNSTKVFQNFVKKHIDNIKKYDREGLFDKQIIYYKRPSRGNPLDFKTKNGTCYITGDYSTYDKRMLVYQIIYLLKTYDDMDVAEIEVRDYEK